MARAPHRPRGAGFTTTAVTTTWGRGSPAARARTTGFWHKNGVVRAEGWFAASQMHGIWRIWNDDGSLDTGLSGVYSDGEREGDLPASSK